MMRASGVAAMFPVVSHAVYWLCIWLKEENIWAAIENTNHQQTQPTKWYCWKTSALIQVGITSAYKCYCNIPVKICHINQLFTLYGCRNHCLRRILQGVSVFICGKENTRIWNSITNIFSYCCSPTCKPTQW